MPIHTMMMTTPSLCFQEYKRLCKKAYELIQKKHYRMIENSEKRLGICPTARRGLCFYINNDRVPRVEVFINPSVLLGGSFTNLYIPEGDGGIESFIFCVNELLREVGLKQTFDELYLSRIDCTRDITFPNEGSMVEFLRCIQKTRLTRDYEAVRFDKRFQNFKELNRHSSRARCDDIMLTAYDKSYQLLEQELLPEDQIPPNLLRVEADFKNSSFQRLRKTYNDCIMYNDNGSKILWFSQMSGRLLRDYFGRALTPGRYLRGDLALRVIDESGVSSKLKDRMKWVVYKVGQCHRNRLEGALKQMKEAGFSDAQAFWTLNAFEEIGLNPATIHGDCGYLEFPSLQELLSEK